MLILRNRGTIFETCCPRIRRAFVVVFLIAAYLLSGPLHTFYDDDVVNSPGSVFVTAGSFDEDSGQSGKTVIVSRHCHGCFSASIPNPLLAASMFIRPMPANWAYRTILTSGLFRGVDLPPPKSLA